MMPNLYILTNDRVLLTDVVRYNNGCAMLMRACCLFGLLLKKKDAERVTVCVCHKDGATTD